MEGCTAHFITDRVAMDAMAVTIAAAERIRVLNPIGHRELFHKEMRWSTAEAARTRDGLDLPTMELKITEEVGFRVAADRKAMDLLQRWEAGQAFMKLTKENIATSSALMLISCTARDAKGLLNAGRAVQRAWLAATANDLAVHPCSAPILLAHHVRHGHGGGFSASERAEVMLRYEATVEAFNLGQREPFFMVRLSFAGAPTARSLRRPITEFLYTHQAIPA